MKNDSRAVVKRYIVLVMSTATALITPFLVAAGTLGTMRTAGMMVSMGIMMILFSLYIGQAEITPVYYPQFLTSVRTGFIIFTVLSILGLLCQLVARGADRALRSE